jgi:hypothetical protein
MMTVAGPSSGTQARIPSLNARYHRLAARRIGKKRALVAVAHSMIVSDLAHPEPLANRIDELGGNYFDKRKKESEGQLTTLRRLEQLTGAAVTIAFQPAAA